MESLLTALARLGADGLSAFWLPLTLWTLVALPASAVLAAWRGLHPLVRYAANTALLVALPLGVAVAAVFDFGTLAGQRFPEGTFPQVVLPLGQVAPGPSAGPGAPGGLHAAGLLTLAALLAAAGRGMRLAVHAWSLRRFGRGLEPAAGGAVAATAEGLARQLGLRRPVRVVVTAQEVVPMTFGWRRPLVVLPAAVAADAEGLRLVLAHELVHVRRHDYAVQWAEQLAGALFALHPLVALLRRANAAYREMACDAEVLARTRCDRQRYARLLYAFVLPPALPATAALGMTGSARHLKTRLLAMKHPAQGRLSPRTAAAAGSALVLALCLTAAACTDVLDVNVTVNKPPEAEAAPLDEMANETFVVVEEMPTYPGGMVAMMQFLQQEIRYPELAGKAGIEGRVVVRFVVDTEGNVLDPTVVKGIGGGCDEEAVRAISKMKLLPGRQAGRLVKVQMTLPVLFRLKDAVAPTSQAGPFPEPGGADLRRVIGQVDRVVAVATRPKVC